ncbi:hypothetical protein G6O69_28320 [Pseudenhygromyxa sp. WMMC2535]|uniref:hypothetical protein n=1 Tax=Pseudenhygromyxa sp. WMMC2535 TaxID=2712867 RepID=UPI0015525B4A|nr:hypothetical protein [Pseudenhygromyxa sp. WMMC2535]NVB41772.1 hypothetical protein [Pseudenhygromyxa sp. WMMC2535]
MSGYQTHELCLTTFAEKPSAVLARARAFLRRGYALIEDPNWCGLIEFEGVDSDEYFVTESIDPTNDEAIDEALAMGYGVQICQKVKLLIHHYTMMLMIVPGDRVGFIWKIESLTFRELFERNGPAGWNQALKNELAGCVFGLVAACGADGFVMKFDRDELRTYTPEELTHSMQHYEHDSPLAGATFKGVKSERLSLEQVWRVACRGRRSKSYYSVHGYTVSDFLRPVDDP